MKKFEYKVIVIATTLALTTRQVDASVLEVEQKLNELGAEGWEFVQQEGSMFFFKRELI